jgi:triacylglycerol lipase
MSSFVELLPEEYDASAFAGFDGAAAGFTLGNARALMWFSQLAYETHRPLTIEAVRSKWGFASVIPFILEKSSLQGSFETCGLIGQRADAVVLAFGGTDPGVWQNLATDFTIVPEPPSDTHRGFQEAAAVALPQIDRAIQLCRQAPGKPLFVAGHSLGAALAGLAALSAAEAGQPPRGVYGFGMPRIGGPQFQSAYDGRLGAVTYRLVHGLDLVARVPAPGLLHRFHHVGRVLQCAAGAKFAGSPAAPGSDEPGLSGELTNALTRGIGGLLSGHVLGPKGPGTFGPLFPLLPAPLRDHLQDSYWKALTP